MNFEAKIREIVAINNVCTVNHLFKVFGVTSFDELEVISKTQEGFVQSFSDEVICIEKYFHECLIDERDFLSSYTPAVQKFLNRLISQTNNCGCFALDNDENWYDEEMTIDDVLTISRFKNHPPYPLIRSYFNEEHKRHKLHMVKKIAQESLYKEIGAVQKLGLGVVRGEVRGDFEFKMVSGQQFFLHSWLLQEHTFFSSMTNFCPDGPLSVTLDTEDEAAAQSFILYLYGHCPDPTTLSQGTISEIWRLADYFQIQSLMQICFILLDEMDYDADYRMKCNLKEVESLFRQSRRNYPDIDFQPYEERMLASLGDKDALKSIYKEMKSDYEHSLLRMYFRAI